MELTSAHPAPSIDPDAVGAVISALAGRFGERLNVGKPVREQHANLTSWHPVEAPDCVVFPENVDEVSCIVKLCATHRVPIIPFGAGTSLEGGANAPFGGVSIDMTRMNAIVALHEEDMDCVVQAGVTRKQLNESLRAHGLFFSVDPGADATMGGMASTRASGTNTVRYGTMKDNVLAMTVVMPDGSIRKTGTRARKSAAGYDITRLMIGAEGTLGVIAELTVKLHGIPQAIGSAVCAFPDLGSACNAVIATIRYGVPIARVELLDEVQIRACNAYSNLDLAEKPTLFLEFHGTEASVEEQSSTVAAIVQEWGGEDYRRGADQQERARLWRAREELYWACLALRPGSKFLATDVCVPISRLADALVATKADVVATGLVAPIVGHVGDGNFHVSVMAMPEDAAEMRVVNAFVERLNARAIEMEGTCTGEHGIGQGKQQFLLREHGDNVETMRMVKRAIDPLNIMNPGKIFSLA